MDNNRFYYLKVNNDGQIVSTYYTEYGERKEHLVEVDELSEFCRRSPFFERFLTFYDLSIDFKKS